MATLVTRSSLGFPNDNVVALNVNQDGTANTAASATIAVPANRFWIIFGATAAQGDATARAIAIEILDASGNVVQTIAGDLVTTVATGIVVRSAGRFIIPAGFSIRANNVAISASTPNLKLTGVEAFVGLPSLAFVLT